MHASLNVWVMPSNYLLMALIAIAMLGGVCVCLSTLSPALQLIALTFVGAIFTFALRRHYFLSANGSIQALRYREEQWYLQLRDAEVEVTLLPTSTLMHSLLVLNFRINESGKKANLVLLPDSAAVDSQRRLKVALRFATISP